MSSIDLAKYPALEGVDFQAISCEIDSDCNAENTILKCEPFGSNIGRLCSCPLGPSRYGPDCNGRPPDIAILQPVLVGLMLLYATYVFGLGLFLLLRNMSKKPNVWHIVALTTALVSLGLLCSRMVILIILFLTDSNEILLAYAELQGAVTGPLSLTFAVLCICVLSIMWLKMIESNPFEKLVINMKLLKGLFTVCMFLIAILVPLLMFMRKYSLAASVSIFSCLVVSGTNFFIGKKLTRVIQNSSILGDTISKKPFSIFNFRKSNTDSEDTIKSRNTSDETLIALFTLLRNLIRSLTRRCVFLLLSLVSTIWLSSRPAGQSRIHVAYWIGSILNFSLVLLPAQVVRYYYYRLKNGQMQGVSTKSMKVQPKKKSHEPKSSTFRSVFSSTLRESA